MAHAQIFLSAVSAEFGSYREPLRQKLARPNVTVMVQEDFIATGTETLDKLDEYIRECDAVIHLVGDMTGALAQAPSLAVIVQRYPDLAERLQVLEPFLKPDAPALSYTQWEAWLALYHRKVLIIAAPEDGVPRDERYELNEVQRTAQQEHLARLARVERYPEIRFANADGLAVEVLRSKLQDILEIAVGKGIAIGDHATVYNNIVQHYPSLKDYAKDFASLIEDATHWFTGREFVFDALANFQQNHPSGYLRIKAGAGLGKTAIAAVLAKHYHAPIHFFKVSEGITRSEDCLNNLSVQIIAGFDLPYDHLPAHAGQDAYFRLYPDFPTAEYAKNQAGYAFYPDFKCAEFCQFLYNISACKGFIMKPAEKSTCAPTSSMVAHSRAG